MSAILRVYHSVVRVLNGVYHATGSLQSAVREVTLDSGEAEFNQTFVLAAGEKRVVWEWADTDGFEYLAVIPEEEAYLRGAHRIDAVTSSTDDTPSTSNGPWNHWSLSCFSPKEFDSDRVYFSTTAGTHVGQSGSVPGIWTTGGTNGVISAVALWNTETTARTVRVYAVQ